LKKSEKLASFLYPLQKRHRKTDPIYHYHAENTGMGVAHENGI
jgi:hypothetical protein